MGEETEINRDVEVVDSLGLRHSMVLFWMLSWKRDHYELMIDANKYRMIGCDEDDTTPLLRYLTHCANSPVTLYTSGIPEGVIKRVYDKRSAEMSPDISFYSKEEYPHRDFALTCGIRASFCFPLRDFRFTDPYGVMEIVSTRNQDVETLVTFCISFEDGRYLCDTFRENINHLQKYANPVLGLLLDEVCQRFQLPLTQYWACDDDSYRLLNQFSDSAFENLTPWCQFKYACLSKSFQCLLGDSGGSPGAFFCNNISALSITTYPLAHYAQNCGSIACFTIYLLILVEEVDEREYVLENGKFKAYFFNMFLM